MTEGDHRPGHAGGSAGRSVWADLFHGPDLRIAIIILVVCGALFYVTTGFDSVPVLLSQNIPATWFPRLLLGVIAVLALILPLEHLFMASGKAHLDAERKARIEPMSMFTALLLMAVVASMAYLGTFLAMVFVSVFLPLLWGERRWLRIAVYAAAFPTAVTLLFTQVLRVYFHLGILERFFD